jgi:serine/threonine protein kinase
MSSLKVYESFTGLMVDILLDSVGNIKFSDFGASKVFAKQGRTRAGVTMARTNLNSMTGTPMYMSPEGIVSLKSFTI